MTYRGGHMKTAEGTRPCPICGNMIPRKWGESASRYNRRQVCWLPLSADGKKQISPCERAAMGNKKRTQEQKAARKANYQAAKLEGNRKARADKWEPKQEITITDYVGAACSVADLVGPDLLASWLQAVSCRTLSDEEKRECERLYQPPIGRQRVGATMLRMEDR